LPAARGAIESLRVGMQKNGSLRMVIGVAAGAQVALLPAGQSVSQLAVQVRAVGAAASPIQSARTVARSATVVAAHAPAALARDMVIAVDAGHGGEDPGASGKQGTQEKNVTLAIARRLLARLQREHGVSAVLTRDGDRFVPLRERAERARRAGADLFVSIHADAVRDRDIEGASVYVLSERGASSEAARILADRENAADLRGVPLSGRPQALASVLVDLSQTAALGSSVEAAGNVLNALDAVGAIRKREVQYAGFAVLKSPDMPSMLVETAYISNPVEEAKLRDPDYQSRLAEAIGSGVLKYLRLHPPDGTRLSLERRGGAAAAQLAQNH
jgi:N-acetylmuramoyl-L-alanine amidase